jgi:hypothetical protein
MDDLEYQQTIHKIIELQLQINSHKKRIEELDEELSNLKNNKHRFNT